MNKKTGNLLNPLQVQFLDADVQNNMKEQQTTEYSTFEYDSSLPDLYNPCADLNDQRWVAKKTGAFLISQ